MAGSMTMEMLSLLRDINAKQDQLVDRVSRVETAIAVGAVSTEATDASFHARLEALEKLIAEDVKPQTDDLRRWKRLGVGFLAISGIGGATVVSALAWFGDTAVTAIRHWLRIT
jgi:hypothetical protein